MSNLVFEESVQCPYCWESFIILIDGSVEHQEYIEDCQVCCRPITFKVTVSEESIDIDALSQDDA